MNNNIFIRSFTTVIPDKRVSAEKIYYEQAGSQSDDVRQAFMKFSKETHIDSVAVFDDDTEFGRAVMTAVKTATDNAGISLDSIKYIIFGNEHLNNINGCSPIHATKTFLNAKSARILPVMHPCAAFLSALELSGKLLGSEKEENILYITGCRWKSSKERFIGFSMRGDGAGAAVISNTGGIFRVNGCNTRYLNNSPVDINGESISDLNVCRFNLIRNGADFINESLSRNNITADDIARIIQPNAGHRVFSELYPHFGDISPEKFYLDNISDGGHICDMDILRNLAVYCDEQKLDSGDMLLLYTPDVEQSFDINYYSALIEKI